MLTHAHTQCRLYHAFISYVFAENHLVVSRISFPVLEVKAMNKMDKTHFIMHFHYNEWRNKYTNQIYMYKSLCN